MKDKFEIKEGNILGSTIFAVRKSKGLTQEELGRKVGLGKSGISKIEKGLTHISAEDASILLHGTNEIIRRPDISKCKSKNDFGKGFYLTPTYGTVSREF